MTNFYSLKEHYTCKKLDSIHTTVCLPKVCTESFQNRTHITLAKQCKIKIWPTLTLRQLQIVSCIKRSDCLHNFDHYTNCKPICILHYKLIANTNSFTSACVSLKHLLV